MNTVQENAQGPINPLAMRIEEHRKKMFRALGIIECVRLASDSMLGEPGEAGRDALEEAYDMLNSVVGDLERIAAACDAHGGAEKPS